MLKQIFTLVACCVLVATSHAAPAKKPAIQAVEDYFNTLTTFQATFMEIQPATGLVQEGTFYLERPKKFLWQYTRPQGQKVVSTGSRLFYVEGDTADDFAQVTQLPLNFGLAAVLTRDTLDLADPALHFESAQETAKNYTLTFRPPAEDEMEAPGTVTLVVQKSPRQLTSITTVDAFGTVTKVTFSDIRHGPHFAPQLFHYTPPQEEDFLFN